MPLAGEVYYRFVVLIIHYWFSAASAVSFIKLSVGIA